MNKKLITTKEIKWEESPDAWVIIPKDIVFDIVDFYTDFPVIRAKPYIDSEVYLKNGEWEYYNITKVVEIT